MGALAEAFQALPFPPLLATEGGGSGDAARHVDIVVSRNTWARRLGASAVNMATFVCLIVVLAVVAAILASRHSSTRQCTHRPWRCKRNDSSWRCKRNDSSWHCKLNSCKRHHSRLTTMTHGIGAFYEATAEC